MSQPRSCLACSDGWAGWIEPADRTWIAFIKTDHTIVVYLDRDPVTGGVR